MLADGGTLKIVRRVIDTPDNRLIYNHFMSTAYTFVPSPSHVYTDHPEHPNRFDLLTPRLDSFGAQKLDVIHATREEVARVHHPKLISALEDVCKDAPAIIDYAPTFVTQSSFDDALLALGG